MANAGGFLTALGQAFTGYGKDQQNALDEQARQQQMAQQRQLQQAQIQEYQAQAQQRQAAAQQRQNEEAVWNQYGQAALDGDQTAIAHIVGTLGEKGAATLKALTREPKVTPKHYDPERGVFVGEDGTVTKLPGLPPRPAPAPNFTPVVLGGADGEPPKVVPFNGRTGTAGAPIGNAKPPVTRIESATNTAAKARLEAAVSEMNNAHAGMDEFEKKLASGQINIGGMQQLLGRAANAFVHDDPASMVIQSAALAAINRQNPELARYIRRGLSFAEGESMISQRPSDFRTKMTAFLSAAASGASPEMIHDIQSRRQSILTPLNRVATPSPAPASTPAAAPASSGNVNLGAKPPLSVRVQQLKNAGISREQAKQVLQSEGYDIHGGE